MSTSSIFQDHAVRVAIAVAITAVLSSQSTTFWSVALILGCLYFISTEVSTARKRMGLPPGDLGRLPVIGDTINFLSVTIDYFMEKRRKYGKSFTCNLIFGLTCVLGDSDDVTWLWNIERKGQAEGFWPPVIKALLGKNSLPIQDGKFHRILRKILEPAFTPIAIKDYIQDIDNVVTKFLMKWASEESDVFHNSKEFKTLALHILFTAAFGGMDNVDSNIMNQVHHDIELWFNGFTSILPVKVPGTAFAKAMDARQRLLDVFEKLILKFKQAHPPESPEAKKSLLGRICYATDEDGHPLSLDVLKDNILVMIFAGHDTTYMSMGTALYYLGKYPEIQEAIVKEVQGTLDVDELKNAHVLNSFIAESWRMNPPINMGFRKVKNSCEYRGYRIRKGQLFGYCPSIIMDDADTYPSPSQFSLSRFLPQDHPLMDEPNLNATSKDIDPEKMSKANYPVFGGGLHQCLGSYFAKLEIRVFLARLLLNHRVEIRNPVYHQFPMNGWSHEFKLTGTAAKQVTAVEGLS